jgi:O-antigen chain-terminating methyltransferase
MAASESDGQAQQLAEIIREIRERVRARHPEGEAPGLGVALPDLMPLFHARDMAAAKVAAIGGVNPRPPGLVNNVIQSVKQTIARALGWFVRDQVEFNRAVVAALEATLEAQNEANRVFAAIDAMLPNARELTDLRSNWIQWREGWENKLLQNEVRYLRGLSELQAAYDVRLSNFDAGHREIMRQQHAEFSASLRQQHAEFTASLSRSVAELQQQLWADFAKVRREYEALIHTELRLVRQKAFSSAAPAQAGSERPGSTSEIDFDYARFADRFRGTEEYVRERQRFYLPYFRDCRSVLDIGCGRGEFLELLREGGIPARGVDLDPESVALCRTKGLDVQVADVFQSLAGEPDGAFDGIFAAQVVEHMAPAQVAALLKLCASKLRQGGVLALETPNPECLAIFATHFYLDPTHQRPIPPALMTFYFEEYGLGGVEVHRLSPAAESMPPVRQLPEGFRNAFFGGLDYAIIGRRL